jgi:hypothetical protein
MGGDSRNKKAAAASEVRNNSGTLNEVLFSSLLQPGRMKCLLSLCLALSNQLRRKVIIGLLSLFGAIVKNSQEVEEGGLASNKTRYMCIVEIEIS